MSDEKDEWITSENGVCVTRTGNKQMKKILLVGSVMVCMLALGSAAQASPINLNAFLLNGSFETPSLGNGNTSTSLGTYYGSMAYDWLWTTTNTGHETYPNSITGVGGDVVINPPPPDGNQIAYSNALRGTQDVILQVFQNATAVDGKSGEPSQTTRTYQANTTYTVSMSIGASKPNIGAQDPWNLFPVYDPTCACGYAELRLTSGVWDYNGNLFPSVIAATRVSTAGGGGVAPPANGNFETISLTFTTPGSGGPVGQDIGIELYTNGSRGDGNSVLWDAPGPTTQDPVPEPATLSLLGLGLLGLGAKLRARRK